MTGDLIDNFLTGLEPTPRAIAARVITSIHEYSQLTVGIKWRQLTFAVDDDFDHWICAVAANPQCVRLVFHFGSMLDDRAVCSKEPTPSLFERWPSYRSMTWTTPRSATC